MTLRPPTPTFFPYTTLFRSYVHDLKAQVLSHLRRERLLVRHPVADRDRLAGNDESIAVGHGVPRSEEHTSELQSLRHLVCRLLLEKKKKPQTTWIAVTNITY